MKKSLFLVALCVFAGHLAAEETPAACKEYEKVSYEFIDAMEKQAKAQGNKEFSAEATKPQTVQIVRQARQRRTGLKLIHYICLPLRHGGSSGRLFSDDPLDFAS